MWLFHKKILFSCVVLAEEFVALFVFGDYDNGALAAWRVFKKRDLCVTGSVSVTGPK